MNLVCNMMAMSDSSSYFLTFTQILMMIACLINLNQHSVTNVMTQHKQMVYVLTRLSI